MNVNLDAARIASAQLRAKLDAAALEVLASGRDWAEGPVTFKGDDYPFEPRSLLEKTEHAVEVKAGACDPGFVPPEGWRVIRHADWVAAGRPGLDQAPT